MFQLFRIEYDLYYIIVSHELQYRKKTFLQTNEMPLFQNRRVLLAAFTWLSKKIVNGQTELGIEFKYLDGVAIYISIEFQTTRVCS